MNLKRSKTFPGTQKPEMDGVYERKYEDNRWYLCKFELKRGWFWAHSIKKAPLSASRETMLSGYQSLPWRGLATRDGK